MFFSSITKILHVSTRGPLAELLTSGAGVRQSSHINELTRLSAMCLTRLTDLHFGRRHKKGVAFFS